MTTLTQDRKQEDFKAKTAFIVNKLIAYIVN